MADDTTAPNGGTAPDLDAWVAGIRGGNYAFRRGVAAIRGQALPVVFGIAPPGFTGKPETWAESVLPDVAPPAFLEEPYPRLTFAQEVARDWGADAEARKARYEALTEKEAGTTPLLYLRALCDGIREDMPRLAEDVYGAKTEARAALLTVLACLPETVAEEAGLDAGALVDCIVDGGDVDECAADLSATIASAFSSNPSAAATARALLGGLRGYDDVDALVRGAVEYAAQQARESAPLLRRAARMFERYTFARAALSRLYAGEDLPGSPPEPISDVPWIQTGEGIRWIGHGLRKADLGGFLDALCVLRHGGVGTAYHVDVHLLSTGLVAVPLGKEYAKSAVSGSRTDVNRGERALKNAEIARDTWARWAREANRALPPVGR